jgi:hypothetical protein
MMELSLNPGINQIVELLKTLPYEDKLIIKNKLDNELIFQKKGSAKSWKDLLLSGPVMTEEGLENYKALKKQFNKWTKKLSA